MSSLVLAGQFRSLPSSERFWFLVSVQNKFRLTRMSSLVLAGQFRSLPSSARPRASSGAGVQELGGANMYHYFCSFFGIFGISFGFLDFH